MKNLLALLRGSRSQSEMARQYGVSQQTWSSWEKGRTRPELGVMLKIQEDYGIPLEVIFYGSIGPKAETKKETNEPST